MNGSNYAPYLQNQGIFYLYKNKTGISFILQMQRIQQNKVGFKIQITLLRLLTSRTVAFRVRNVRPASFMQFDLLGEHPEGGFSFKF